MKYVLVTGGVISGIGKGVIASSLGTILKSSGVRVTSIKIDPYINIDAGTFSPYEHGECWLSCQPRVRVRSCFVNKVIRDLESIDHLCINPIHRIGLILMWSIDSHYPKWSVKVNALLNNCKQNTTSMSHSGWQDSTLDTHADSVNVLKFWTRCQPKRPRQAVQTGKTLIKLLLQKQSDQGLPSLLFRQAFGVLTSPVDPNFLWKQKVKSVWNFWTFTIVYISRPVDFWQCIWSGSTL